MIDHLKGQLETTPTDSVAVDRELGASVPGVYAVGDLLCLHVKQAVVTAADGVVAAMAVDKYVHGREKVQPDWK